VIHSTSEKSSTAFRPSLADGGEQPATLKNIGSTWLEGELSHPAGWRSCDHLALITNNCCLCHLITMSWRNQGITGSNNIPLGSRRRMGGDGGAAEDGSPAPTVSDVVDLKRGRDPEPRSESDGPRVRKKRNRWGDAASENKAAGLMGLPTAILSAMTSEQLEAYTLHLRIEEISQKLRINDVVPADGDRSPSPPPQYDNHGRRVNTREYRYRKRLEDERHKLIERAMKTIPNYHPPQDYRRPTKTQEKVYVPVNDYPEINFSMITNSPILTNIVFSPLPPSPSRLWPDSLLLPVF
jgi:splicing factor 1